MVDFLPVHIAGADWPHSAHAVKIAQSECHEDVAARRISANGKIPDFYGRVRCVGKDIRFIPEDVFNLPLRQTVRPTFGPIAIIPLEAIAHVFGFMLYKCIYK